MKREYYKRYSKDLRREMEFLVHGHAGMRVLVFPTRGGRFHDFEDWGMLHSLQHHIDQGWMQLYCVDSVDNESFYCDWAHPSGRIQRHEEYEQYILNDIVSLSTYLNSSPTLMSLGCSLGAYHAMNIALRHPNLFDRVLALSGRYSLLEQTHSFRDLLDGYYSDKVYFHTPLHFLQNMEEGEALSQIRELDLRFVIGKQDAFYSNNRRFRELLNVKDIPHQFLVWEGEAHSPRHWRNMLPLYV